jgi:3-dehydroquinate synthase
LNPSDALSTSHIQVSLGERSYSIAFTTGELSSKAIETIQRLSPVSHVVVIADQAVEPHVQILQQSFRKLELRQNTIFVKSGEGSKSFDQITELWNQMLEAKTDRASVIVAVGGGVIGDLAGFAAASYARGLRFLQIPTTLLAMVDSSVGGKTGINLPKAKNMVGAFWQPSAVIIDTSTLETLADREYRSGLAEIVKYGVILDPQLFHYLEINADAVLKRDPTCLRHIIMRSCELKAQVVEQDERETTGLRAILNYGHTFAHAIEAATAYGQLLHGEAVAIGMNMAARLAVQLGMFTHEETQRQLNLLQRFQLPTEFSEVSPEKLWSLMQHDKKVEQGQLRFILPTRIGHVERRSGVTQAQAIEAMKSLRI